MFMPEVYPVPYESIEVPPKHSHTVISEVQVIPLVEVTEAPVEPEDADPGTVWIEEE